MMGLRIWTKMHPALALGLIAVALIVKAFVPQGYMVASGKTLTIALCSGSGPAAMTIDVPMESGKTDQPHDKKSPDHACPFSALGHAAAPGVDGALLLATIAFALALGFAPRSLPPLRRLAYIQPPLRGPPSIS